MNTYIKENFEYNHLYDVDSFFQNNANLIKNVVGKFLRTKYTNITLYDIDEVFQEVAFKIVKNGYISKYSSEKSSLNTWLYIISRSVAIDYMRKKKRIYINIDDFEDVVEFEEDEISFSIPEGLLSNRQSEVIKMIFWGDLKAVEVAQHLGITARTVRSLKHQAILKLRRHFGATKVRRVVS